MPEKSYIFTLFPLNGTIHFSGKSIQIFKGKSAALLAALLTAENYECTTAQLLNVLWKYEQGTKNSLHVLVSRIKLQLPGYLVATSQVPGYRLNNITDEDVDFLDVRLLLSEAKKLYKEQHYSQSLKILKPLKNLLVSTHNFETPIFIDIASHVEKLHMQIQNLRFQCFVKNKDFELLLKELPDSDNEQYGYYRCFALSQLGKVSEAIKEYEKIRHNLRENFGISPDHHLQKLHAKLLKMQEKPLKSKPSPSKGINYYSDPLIGREKDITAMLSSLKENRLITILGPGGLGKTRLAHEVARHLEEHYRTYIIELSHIRSDDDICLEINYTLTLEDSQTISTPTTSAQTALIKWLNQEHTILIFDNCEHLMPTIAQKINTILRLSPTTEIIATSRSPLNLHFEILHHPTSLLSKITQPEPAITLFKRRAQSFTKINFDPEIVGKICRLLDALPLAIELAAVKLRFMNLDELYKQLSEHTLALKASNPFLPQRHQSLEALISWSWELLNIPEQKILTYLSLLPAGFTRESAIKITQCTEDDFHTLMNHSLILKETYDQTDRISRYSMLETVREFSEEQLKINSHLPHAMMAIEKWVQDFIVTYSPLIHSPEQATFLRMVTPEYGNLVWFLTNSSSYISAMMTAKIYNFLGYYLIIRGNMRGLLQLTLPISDILIKIPLKLTTAQTLCKTYTLILLSQMRHYSSLKENIHSFVEENLQKLQEFSFSIPSADFFLSQIVLAMKRPHLTQGIQHILKKTRNSEDSLTSLLGYLMSAHVAENQGDLIGCEQYASQAYSLACSQDNIWAAAISAETLGQIYSETTRPLEAIQWSDVSQSLKEQLNFHDDALHIAWIKIYSYLNIGEIQKAWKTFKEFAPIVPKKKADFITKAVKAEILRLENHHKKAHNLFTEVLHTLPNTSEFDPWLLLSQAQALSGLYFMGENCISYHAFTIKNLVDYLTKEHKNSLDIPVVAAFLLGISAWHFSHDRSSLAIKILALASKLGPRQDPPTLNVAMHQQKAEKVVGEKVLKNALMAVETLNIAQCIKHIVKILDHT